VLRKQGDVLFASLAHKADGRCTDISKKKSKKKIKVLSDRDVLKIEIAKELGIWEQVESEGWKSLTNAACGRVGGIMRKRLQDHRFKRSDC
jgi:hypothetical protein